MAKYDPLRDHLAGVTQPTVRMTFNELARLVGSLPAAAWQHRDWWANDAAHDEAQAWLDAGWRVAIVDQRDEWVEFEHDPSAG